MCMILNPCVYCPAEQVENIPCPGRADFMLISVYMSICRYTFGTDPFMLLMLLQEINLTNCQPLWKGIIHTLVFQK